MKIGVISDTHGNEVLTEKAISVLVGQENIDRLFHLGDSYDDGQKIVGKAPVVEVVPGIYCPEYFVEDVPNVIINEVEGWQIALVHKREDVKDEQLNQTDIILYGHTHQYDISEQNGKWYINPGHLKAHFDKGREASAAVLDVSPESITVTILGTEGEPFEQKTLKK